MTSRGSYFPMAWAIGNRSGDAELQLFVGLQEGFPPLTELSAAVDEPQKEMRIKRYRKVLAKTASRRLHF
jgi:hypothetical protein